MADTSGGDRLLEALRDPRSLLRLDGPGWNGVMRRARLAKLVAKLGILAEEAKITDRLPAKVLEHFAAARAEADQHGRVVRWEVNRIHRALAGVDSPVVLIKGAAYVMAGLPLARGRLVSDVDILVPEDRLGRVEAALREHEWEQMKLDPYDQRYYRQWMHELPPMKHKYRRTCIDVHHTILPKSGRLQPDPALLLESARPIVGHPFKVLSPVDMVLHTAVHLFQDGEVVSGLRDLTDLDDLLKHFSSHEPGFWEQLVPGARRLGLQRPLYYALWFSWKLLGTPVPQHVLDDSSRDGPVGAVRVLMDRLVSTAIIPTLREHEGPVHGLARWLLYVRSHWLRMPARLLIPHLYHKAMRRWKRQDEEEDEGTEKKG